MTPARLVAFEILQRVNASSYASVLLADRGDDLDPRDRALCHELVMGVLRWQLWLDHVIQHFADRKLSGLDLPVKIALRLGIYQLRFLSRIPASAAVNESVNLVRLARLRSAEGFVNAVLRRATRETEYDPSAALSDPIERLSSGNFASALADRSLGQVNRLRGNSGSGGRKQPRRASCFPSSEKPRRSVRAAACGWRSFGSF